MLNKKLPKNIEHIALVCILLFTTLIYLNHFDNGFYFDDTHTISNNTSIKTLKNWTSFFTDASTFSSLPPNQSYRPMVTLMNAIDYAIGGDQNKMVFHLHIFLWYLVLIVLLFYLIKKIYSNSLKKNKWIPFGSLFAVLWFGTHTINAETINYICARSDSFSTLAIVASLLLYINPIGKKYYLYLITTMIGIWTKQTGVMFVPILFVYIILFENNKFLSDFKKNYIKDSIQITKKISPISITAIGLFLFNQYYLTPKTTVSTNFNVTLFEYITTQFYVIAHYIGNFILPINLSADPDITIIKPWYDSKIIFGLTVILILTGLMIKTALKNRLRPISFGIAWFFIALLPTTFNPLFQIANDHRMFFPFIGFFIALPFASILLIEKFSLEKRTKNFQLKILLIPFLIIICYSFGTIQRNIVWDNSASLWKDVSIKSPKNGRGLMNYGLSLMSKGDYKGASSYFERALEFSPNYSTLYVNLGILNGAQKKHDKAIKYFEKAKKLNLNSPAPYYYYARYLFNKKKYLKSKKLLNEAILLSPNHSLSTNLLSQIEQKNINELKLLKKTQKNVLKNPTAKGFLELSYKYYDLQKYPEAIYICKEGLKVYPNNANLYNNLCVNYNQLKQWKKGIQACEKALKLKPNFQLAKNNLRWAQKSILNK